MRVARIQARITGIVGNLHRPESLQHQDLLGATRAEQSSRGTRRTGGGSAPSNSQKPKKIKP
jgi:hypothetical protein